MAEAKKLEDVKFPGETLIKLDDSEADFERAQAAAYARVRKYDSDPLLLAWYDKKTGRQSPNESCEEEGGAPGWVNYAKGHGGNLTVNVNGGDYVFMFKSKHEFTRTATPHAVIRTGGGNMSSASAHDSWGSSLKGPPAEARNGTNSDTYARALRDRQRKGSGPTRPS